MTEATVAIADDHPLFRTALKQAVLESLADTTITEAENFDQLLELIEHTPSLEIIFLDLHMPGNHGFRGLSQLQNNYPNLVVIMVSADESPDIMRKAISLGAAAFIPKSADLATLSNAINAVLDDEIWLPQGIDINLQSQDAQQDQSLAAKIAQLTPQQYSVLTFIADGKLNKEIGYTLNISENTVKKHVSAILLQLGCNNRTQASLIYQQLMLTPQAQ